jgi:hypothetical protein
MAVSEPGFEFVPFALRRGGEVQREIEERG